jgi:hypothetical protein
MALEAASTKFWRRSKALEGEVRGSGGGRSVWRRSKCLEASNGLEAFEGCGGGQRVWRRLKAVEAAGSSGGGRKL